MGGVGAHIAAEIERRTGKETRAVVLGHLQRGGGPTNFDRALCTIFGTTAVELIAKQRFGQMVTYTGAQVTSVALAEAIGQLRACRSTAASCRLRGRSASVWATEPSTASGARSSVKEEVSLEHNPCYPQF